MIFMYIKSSGYMDLRFFKHVAHTSMAIKRFENKDPDFAELVLEMREFLKVDTDFSAAWIKQDESFKFLFVPQGSKAKADWKVLVKAYTNRTHVNAWNWIDSDEVRAWLTSDERAKW